MRNAGDLVLESFFAKGIDRESYRSAVDFVNTSLKYWTDEWQVLSVLSLLNEHDNVLYAHCLGVSVFSALIGKELGWKSPGVLSKLALAGLLHDIGLRETDRRIHHTPYYQLNAQERSEFESHPLRGKEILASIKGVPLDVIQIVGQHHEACAHQAARKGIHPMAKVVQVADMFCEYAIGYSQNGKPISAHGAINTMEALRSDQLDKDILLALKRVIKR